jgi:nitrile hydratase beta subunit
VSYHSHADLGGQDIHAGIVQEAEGDHFHAPGESRVMALVVAMGPTGLSNIDMNRATRETLPNYRDLTYYEIWLKALETLVAQRGVSSASPPAPRSVMHAASVATMIAQGSRYSRIVSQPARFHVGQQVRTIGAAAQHHTRLPNYARGKLGVIERVHGAHVFPDTNAHGLGESPQWLYNVAFEARELWGEAAQAQRCGVSIDAFEPYLEAA